MEAARLEEEKQEREEKHSEMVKNEEEEEEESEEEGEEEENEDSLSKKPSDSKVQPINEASNADTQKELAKAEASIEPTDGNQSKPAVDNAAGEPEEWVEAIYDYTKTPDTPELSFNVGDKMKVLRKFASGWMEVLVDLLNFGKLL